VIADQHVAGRRRRHRRSTFAPAVVQQRLAGLVAADKFSKRVTKP
jgi:hypothetical protein